MAIPTQSLLQGTSRVTQPSVSILAGASYTPSHKTDIRVLFAKVKAELAAKGKK